MQGNVVCFSLSLSPAALLLVWIRQPSKYANVCIYAHIIGVLKKASMDKTPIVILGCSDHIVQAGYKTRSS